ncbi:MAG: hypothetical protein A3J29_01825 [Acidobacteria bacterium RIFCSPLOWO2_12_FULL_67_14b]|nr:MAG: hypothetical protein A3J29_01825 [Acidobacteria bacterium RIFCSPLOWO2_12_FULL_67_14b]
MIRYTLFGNLKLFGSLSLCLSVAKQFHNFKLAIRHARSHEAQRLGEAHEHVVVFPKSTKHAAEKPLLAGQL